MAARPERLRSARGDPRRGAREIRPRRHPRHRRGNPRQLVADPRDAGRGLGRGDEHQPEGDVSHLQGVHPDDDRAGRGRRDHHLHLVARPAGAPEARDLCDLQVGDHRTHQDDGDRARGGPDPGQRGGPRRRRRGRAAGPVVRAGGRSARGHGAGAACRDGGRDTDARAHRAGRDRAPLRLPRERRFATRSPARC